MVEMRSGKLLKSHITERYTEAALRGLCFDLPEPAVKWDDLVGTDLSGKVMSLLTRVENTGRSHELLCALARYNTKGFLDDGLHELLYSEGVQLVKDGLNALSKRRVDILPYHKEAWEHAYQVFTILRDIHPDYLQGLLGTDPDTQSAGDLERQANDLLQSGKWENAVALLEKFAVFLPEDDRVYQLLSDIREVTQLCGRISRSAAEGKWGEAKAEYDRLVKLVEKYPGCPELEHLHEKFKEPDSLLRSAVAAVGEEQWSQAEKLKGRLLPRYETYPGVSDFVARLDRPRTWLANAQKWVDARAWERVEDELAALLPEDRTYPGVLELQRKIEEGETLYRRACQHMESQQWEAASQALAELESSLPGFRHADVDPSTIQKGLEWAAQAKEQMRSKEWAAAEHSIEQAIACLPQHEGAQQLLGQLQRYKKLYESANQSFSEHRYDEAWEAYCALAQDAPGYQDGQKKLDLLEKWRALYADGLSHVAAREWAEASHSLAKLAQQQPDYRDVGSLLTHVQHVMAVQSALQSPLVNDPLLSWEQGGCPYASLQTHDAHMTSAASMKQIQDALYALQAEGTLPPETRAAWDELRSTDRRLFVDAYLYRVPQADKVVEFIEAAVAQDRQFPSADKLASAFAEAAPVVLLLVGQRDEAVEKWRARQRERPRSGAWAHALAVCCLANACQAERVHRVDAALAEWRKALAQFALAVNDRNYWREWGRERSETYGRPVLPSLTEELGQKIESDLLRRLLQRAGHYAQQGHGDLAARYRQLEIDFKAELSAVQLLKGRGGLSLATGRQAWFGPLFLDWEPDFAQDLAHYCAELSQQPGDVVSSLLEGKPAESTIRRLRCYFSSLKYAAVLLEIVPPNPTGALEQLTHANCGKCPKTCKDKACTLHHASTSLARLCCPSCSNFNPRNPAYVRLPEPGQALRQDACYLAVQAHLRLAAARMEGDEKTPLESITSEWQLALELARDWGGESDVREDMRQTLLMGTSRLVGHWLTQHDDTCYIDRAIALLDYAYQSLGQDKAIVAKLAELLTDRGIYQANRDKHREAKADLERAYTLMRSPTDRTRDNYATALILVAQDTARHDRPGARQLLDQAARLIHEGQQLRPDYAEYARTEQLLEMARRDIEGQPVIPPAEDLLQELTQLLGPADKQKDTMEALVTQGITLRQRGDLPAALEILERAWQQAPHRIDVQEELVATLAQRVEQLEAEGAYGQGTDLIATWRERLADTPKMILRLNFAKWSPRLKRDLEQIGFFYHMGPQEFMLPFDADILGTVMVRLTAEEELLKLVAPLPLPSLDDEAVLSNLLQVTGDLGFYKVCSFETASLALAACVPLPGLPVNRLELLARALSRYADISPVSLSQIGALRDHVGRVREINQMDALRLNLPSQDLRPVQTFAKARGWRWGQAENGANLFGPPGTSGEQALPWRVKADFDAISLEADLGYLRAGGNQLGLLQRLLRLNGVLGLGKLALSSEAHLQLAVNLPIVDQMTFDMAVQVLEANSERLRRDLTQS